MLIILETLRVSIALVLGLIMMVLKSMYCFFGLGFMLIFIYNRTPMGLEDVSTYPKLVEYLVSQDSWSNEDIIKLIGGNILRVMEENERVKKD
jgi:microsomal dipeptidase-like Zn-dependent dipeptidase